METFDAVKYGVESFLRERLKNDRIHVTVRRFSEPSPIGSFMKRYIELYALMDRKVHMIFRVYAYLHVQDDGCRLETDFMKHMCEMEVHLKEIADGLEIEFTSD